MLSFPSEQRNANVNRYSGSVGRWMAYPLSSNPDTPPSLSASADFLGSPPPQPPL